MYAFTWWISMVDNCVVNEQNWSEISTNRTGNGVSDQNSIKFADKNKNSTQKLHEVKAGGTLVTIVRLCHSIIFAHLVFLFVMITTLKRFKFSDQYQLHDERVTLQLQLFIQANNIVILHTGSEISLFPCYHFSLSTEAVKLCCSRASIVAM